MYKDEKRGATYIALQSNINESEFRTNLPNLDEYPVVKINVKEKYVRNFILRIF